MKVPSENLLLSILIFSLLLNIGNGTNEQDPEITLASVQNLPPDVLKLLLKRGQDLKDVLPVTDLGPETRKLDIVDNYALKLYEWIIKNALKGTTSPLRYLNVICFPQGCIDIADVGIHP